MQVHPIVINFYPQGIFEICKSNRIDLLLVDLNEPQKGKT